MIPPATAAAHREEFITAPELARRLSMSERTVRERQLRGELEHVKIGGSVRFPWHLIESRLLAAVR